MINGLNVVFFQIWGRNSIFNFLMFMIFCSLRNGTLLFYSRNLQDCVIFIGKSSVVFTFCGCQKTEVKKIKIQNLEVTKLKLFHNESAFETAKMIFHTRSIYHILNLILMIEAIKRKFINLKH